MSLRDLCVSLPNRPCTGTNPKADFLYAKKIEKNDPGEGSDNPTWEVRYVVIDSLKDGPCDETEKTQMPRRLGKLVFNYDKLVFEKNDKIADDLFNFLQLTCVVITGTETTPPHFMSYLQLSKPVEIPPTAVTVPTDGSFTESIIKPFKLNRSIRETWMRSQQALYKFQKSDLVWINATLRPGAVTTQPLSWTTQVNEANNRLPCTFKWKYKNDEAQSLEWKPLEWKPHSDKETTVLHTSCTWGWRNFQLSDWQNIDQDSKKQKQAKDIYETVLKHVVSERPLNDKTLWEPLCQNFLRSNLPKDICKTQGVNFTNYTFTVEQLRENLKKDLKQREANLKSTGAIANDAKDKIANQITKLEKDYPTKDTDALSLKKHIEFLERSLLEKPWPELTKSAKVQADKAGNVEPKRPVAPQKPLDGAAKDKTDAFAAASRTYETAQATFNGLLAEYDKAINKQSKNILGYEVKEYLKQNENKLSQGEPSKDAFALYCYCFLWDKLKDMEDKILSQDDIDAMVKGLKDTELSINFDLEIRWDKAAFPAIDPSVFGKGPVTVVIKTDKKADRLMPFRQQSLSDDNAASGKSNTDLDSQKRPMPEKTPFKQH